MLVEIRDEDIYKVIPAYCGFNNTEEEKRIPITMISDADPTIRESYTTVRNFIFNTFAGYEIDTPHSLVIEFKKKEYTPTEVSGKSKANSSITVSSNIKDENTDKDFSFTLDILDDECTTIKGSVTLDEFDNVVFFRKFDENGPKFKKNYNKQSQGGAGLIYQTPPLGIVYQPSAPTYDSAGYPLFQGNKVTCATGVNTQLIGRNDSVIDTSTGSSVTGSELKIDNPGVNVEGSGTIVTGNNFKIAKPNNGKK